MIHLFLGLTREQQLDLIKKLIAEKISNSECWDRCDLRAMLRILKLLRTTP